MDISFKDQQHTRWEEAQYLINTLRAWGITYLVGDEVPTRSMEDQQSPAALIALITQLAQCSYPRIRDASISLFLLHPELAPIVLEAIDGSETAVAAQITTLVLATLYLQRLWSIRLTLASGHIPSFPEQPFAPLWHTYHLPPPACHDGKWGLYALQQMEQQCRST